MDAKNIARTAGLVFGNDHEKVKIATAVALAESGGDENAIGHNTNGTVDVGLWQINSVHKRNHPEWTTEWLKNPNNNATAMNEISGHGSNWCPWYVYEESCGPGHNGRYRNYLDEAESVKDIGGASTESLPGVGDIASLDPFEILKALVEPIQNIANIIMDTAKWVGNPDNWLRIIQVSGGIVLAISAAYIVGKPISEAAPGPSIDDMKKTVVSAVKKGK